jgi:hypothetical protein
MSVCCISLPSHLTKHPIINAVYSEIKTALSVFSKFFCLGYCTVYLLSSFSLTRLFAYFPVFYRQITLCDFRLLPQSSWELGYYPASSGNLLLPVLNNLSVPSSGFKNPKQSLFPQCRIYVEEHGWWRVSIVQCQPVGLLWVVVLYFGFSTICYTGF